MFNATAARQACPTLLIALLGLSGAPAAWADDNRYPRDQVCPKRPYVDKEALAKAFLERYRIGKTFRDAMPPSDTSTHARQMAALMRMGEAPCDKMGEACNEYEKQDSSRMMVELAMLFNNPRPDFILPEGTAKEGFFETPNHVNPLLCAPDDLQAGPGGKEKDNFLSRLRLRGTPSDLVYPRGTQGFATTAPAVFSIERDELSQTRTVSSNAYVGLPFAEKTAGLTKTGILAYVGVARNSARVDGKNDPDQKVSQLHAGLNYEWHEIGKSRLSVRPAYFHDRVDKTRVLTGNVEYTPFWTLGNNALRATNVLNTFPSVEIQPVVRGRIQFGHYMRRSRDPDTALGQDNFLRAGGVLGVDILGRDIPLEYHFSYTGLAGLNGVSTISHVTHGIGLSFDANKYASLLLAYSRGTNEETLLREKQWKLTFALRF